MLKMKPWVHYIPHNGSVKSILKSYKKIEKNKFLYNKMSKETLLFAKNNFTTKAVRLKFFTELKNKIYTKVKKKL